jgi:hypothetical protein
MKWQHEDGCLEGGKRRAAQFSDVKGCGFDLEDSRCSALSSSWPWS